MEKLPKPVNFCECQYLAAFAFSDRPEAATGSSYDRYGIVSTGAPPAAVAA